MGAHLRLLIICKVEKPNVDGFVQLFLEADGVGVKVDALPLHLLPEVFFKLFFVGMAVNVDLKEGVEDRSEDCELDGVIFAQFNHGISTEVLERLAFLSTVQALDQLVHCLLVEDDFVFLLSLSQFCILLVLFHLKVNFLQASLATEIG